MQIGIGTYALFWEWNSCNPRPMSTADMIQRAAELECDVFQICDDPYIAEFDAGQLLELHGQAENAGVTLELGTRGTASDHLGRYISMAQSLGAHTLRSMVTATTSNEEAIGSLSSLLPDLERAEVTLALETYEQIPTSRLIEIVRAVGSPLVGICLDPANCVSALEHPQSVIQMTAPFTTNLHVKDFAFSRAEGWVGFQYAGAELGQGLLNLDHELSAVYADGRDPSAIVEHWVPWQSDIDSTLARERRRTDTSLAALREWRAKNS